MLKNKGFVGIFAGAIALAGGAGAGFAHAAQDVRTVALEALPGWAQDSLYSGLYLDIDKVMQAEQLSRFEAVEVQNRLRDAQDRNPGVAAQAAYEAALVEARARRFESGWRPSTFQQPGEFVAALDMDETLLMQWYAGGAQGFFDLRVMPDSVGKLLSGPYVKLTPGAEEFIKGLKANPRCKGVVVFSAKADAPAIDTVRKWTFAGGESARRYIDAVFTRNHLVMGKKTLLPSKDLRIIDPELKHVVLVDDNPARVMQPQALKAQPKFDADGYLKAKTTGDATTVAHYEAALGVTLKEIEESSESAQRSGRPFTQEFLPFSYSGERLYRNMLRVMKSRPAALEATRARPHLQEAAFVPANKP